MHAALTSLVRSMRIVYATGIRKWRVYLGSLEEVTTLPSIIAFAMKNEEDRSLISKSFTGPPVKLFHTARPSQNISDMEFMILHWSREFFTQKISR